MSNRKEIGIGVLGLGFMGRTHVRAYAQANERGFSNRLVAVCDSNPERRAGRTGEAGNMEDGRAPERMFDPESLTAYEFAAPLLADPAVDLVSICTPTDTHVDLAIEALAMGKHVLLEKPVALESKDVARLLRASSGSNRLCMPAHCMRFWPGWDWLRDVIHSGEYGGVLEANFRRISPTPGWSPEFYGDPLRSGGALVDLHIHDADFILWAFGPPLELACRGTADHFKTEYSFATNAAKVTAEAAWDPSPDCEFKMTYEVQFENARARFDVGAQNPLQLEVDGTTESIGLDPADGYQGEIEHLVERIHRGHGELRVNMEDALAVANLLELERASLLGG